MGGVTSASVTAAPAYLSGGSIITGVMAGIALAADAVAVQRFNVLAGDPLAAEVAAAGREDTGFPTTGADEQFLIVQLAEVACHTIIVAYSS